MLKKYYPVLIIISLAVFIQLPIWLGLIDFYSGDISDLIPYFYGTKLLLHQTFQKFKEIPFWNPYIMFGQPIVGNTIYGLFYPLNLIFLLIPFVKALWIYNAVHMIIAGLGAYLLAIHLGCNKNGGMVAGCLYMLNGRLLYYINAGWMVHFGSICWLPLFVLASILVIKRNERRYPVAFGIVFAMTFLSGTPQYTLLGFYLFLLQGVWNLFLLRSKAERLSLLFRILLSGLLSILLISIQLFSAVEQTFLSSRVYFENINTIHGFYFDWNPKLWLRILLRPEYHNHDFSWELSAYIGIGAMVLSVLGLFTSKKAWQHVIVWGLIPLLLSMGPAFSSFSNLFARLPGMSMLINPSRYFIFTILMACLLSGLGLDRFLCFENGRKKSYLVIIAAGLSLFFIGFVVSPYSQTTTIVNLRYFGAVIIFLLMAGLYIWRGTSYFRIIFICWLIIDPILISSGILKGYNFKDLKPPLKIIQAIKDYNGHARIASIQLESLRGYRFIPFPDWICIQSKIDRAGGYEPLAMLSTLQYLNKMEGTRPVAQTMWYYRLLAFARPALFNLGGITHLITFKPINDSRLKFVTRDFITMPHFCGDWWRKQPVYLYENTSVLPRAFFLAENTKFLADPVKLRFVSPDHRQIYLRTKQSGIVVVSESFHPDWIATQKDKPIAVRPFLNTFISFYVPAGEHEIMLEFKPESFHLGQQFTLAGLLLILVVLLLHRKEAILTITGFINQAFKTPETKKTP